MLVKIKVDKLYHSNDIKSDLRAVQNKLLMYSQSNRIIMFTDVSFPVETETYGRKKKTREVQYLQCKMHGWNQDGEFCGTYTERQVTFVLNTYRLLVMLKTMMEFERQYQGMKALHDEVTTPDIVKAVP